MDEIQRLVQTSELKTNLLREQANNPSDFQLDYDRDFDAIIIKLSTLPGQEVVAHYVDGQVALLYLADSLEVIGIQVEDFAYSFMPRHDEVQRVWRLSDTSVDTKDFGEVVFTIQKWTPKVAREVVRAVVSEEELGQPGNELTAAFAFA